MLTLLYLVNKRAVCIFLMQRPGNHPFSKKKICMHTMFSLHVSNYHLFICVIVYTSCLLYLYTRFYISIVEVLTTMLRC
uniref:Uncharacterized protein n=1 Tax=Triticum urartu TaxID=4572 RepID=A0A8R7RBL2_TRIUA